MRAAVYVHFRHEQVAPTSHTHRGALSGRKTLVIASVVLDACHRDTVYPTLIRYVHERQDRFGDYSLLQG